MNSFWFAFWFFLPAGLANMAPILINKIPIINRWDTPLDFGKNWQGKVIFGNNKTWRGLLFGTLVGAFAGLLIYPHLFLQGQTLYWSALLGGLLGFGALAGDSIESFFKRRVGKLPGEVWFPFDQTDYIIGGLLMSLFVVHLPLASYLITLVSYFILHLLSSYIGYMLKLKDKPI